MPYIVSELVGRDNEPSLIAMDSRKSAILPWENTLKIAYLDCFAGISGDMTLGALVDAGVDLDALNAAVESLGLPDCRLVASEVKKGGFRATKVDVLAPHEHVHRHLADIEPMIDAAALSDAQKGTARRLFRRLAVVEAEAHGTTVEKVHFHEVGAADSIADIVGSVVGFDLLGVDRVLVSPIPTGTGSVRIAHGLCSIPAPATAAILRGAPLATANIEGEMTTPTGALIATEIGDSFGPLPAMRIDRIGLGAGSKDWPDRPNILRLFVGESADAGTTHRDTVWLLETNLDDADGETVAHAVNLLWKANVLEAWTAPISMKKGRPGILLSVLVQEPELATAEAVLFETTGTLGIRRRLVERTVLPRVAHTVGTKYGPVLGKARLLPCGAVRFKPEYESCRAIAEAGGASWESVAEAAKGAFDPEAVRFAADDPARTDNDGGGHHSHPHEHAHEQSHEHAHKHD